MLAIGGRRYVGISISLRKGEPGLCVSTITELCQKDDNEGSEEEVPMRPQSDAGAQFGSNGSKKKKS